MTYTEPRSYLIAIKDGETWEQYCTRLANEIKVLDCKIVSCDIDVREGVTTIVYKNRRTPHHDETSRHGPLTHVELGDFPLHIPG